MTSCPAFTQIPPRVLPILPEPITPIFRRASAPIAVRTACGRTPRARPAAPACRNPRRPVFIP